MAALSGALPTAQSHTTTPVALPKGLGSFQSYSQLEGYIAANAKSAQQYNRYPGGFGGPVVWMGGVATMTAAATVATFASSSTVAADIVANPSYTGTNVQVQGVDELDRVKTDGTHLFVSNGDSVTIINAYPPNSTRILSTLLFPSSSVMGIEIYQGHLLVLAQRMSNGTHVDLLLYDVSNPSAPTMAKNMSVSGNFVAARLADGYLYAIIQQPSYVFNPQGNATAVMPTAYEDGSKTTLPPSSVYYTPDRAQISVYTMIVSMSMATGDVATLSVLTGPASTVYVSPSNIYVLYTIYPNWYADEIPGDIYTGGVMTTTAVMNSGQNSSIFRASYSDGIVTAAAAGSVPGTVLNQFSMDEYQGYFRVATSRFTTIDGTYTHSDDVYVLNLNMVQVGSITNIAPGENIYAVRFDGDMGYVVTFVQVDPLFAISFKDVTHPVIVSALKVNGYSNYLHPLPGGYLIGVGKDTVPASDGNYAYYLGLKLSLFRVYPNGTSVEVAKYLIGDRGTDSPVLSDHLAFTFDSSKNITVIPVSLYLLSGNQTYSPGGWPPYGNYVWQGVYVFKVTTTGFDLLGRVSQYTNAGNAGDSPSSNLDIDRSVIIGNFLYTISQGEVMVSDLSNFSTVATVQLPS